MLIAALMSRSWCVPQLAQIHSRSLSVSVSFIAPHALQVLLDGLAMPVQLVELLRLVPCHIILVGAVFLSH